MPLGGAGEEDPGAGSRVGGGDKMATRCRPKPAWELSAGGQGWEV